jgi:cytochrome c oxidase assembly protein subunit 15
VLCIIAWKTESRRWVRNLCYGVLGAVIFQGVLGGLRVVLVKLDLAIVHACFAQAFFCLTALAAVVTSRWWTNVSLHPREDAPDAGRALVFACVAALVIIYLQLVAGALMRHEQAGLAVPDFPLAYGMVIPHTDPASLAQINALRAWDLHLPPVTAAQIWLHMAHRLGAVLVTLAILLASGLVILKYRARRALLAPAILLLALLAAQVTLGILTVLLRKPADVASAHVAVGALVLVCSFVLTVRSIRLYASRARALALAAAQPAVNYSYDEPVFA